MTRHSVFLELADDGHCMAHVPGLPGCFVRAGSRDEAMRRLPDAIRDYHAWLRRHGEPTPPEDEPIEFDVAGESIGGGPFDPGDAAALFPPDREPVTAEETEHYFRLAFHARADLLELVRDLPDDILDWQPDPESFSIRRILRHVGNAEEWYVSRVVPPETLPAEWEEDESLPIFEFLEMERRTAVARLRQLTAEQRSAVVYPTRWTDHPDEPWTARKALRRCLEHELEHTGQIREVLAGWRAQLLTRLACERITLLEQVAGLDHRVLTGPAVIDDWTAKDLLAHVAGWDELFAERIGLILAGRQDEIISVEIESRNAALHAERRDWPLERATEACVTARSACLDELARLPDGELHRLRRLPLGEVSVRTWAQWRGRHDAAHAADLATWRLAQDLASEAGPRAVALARLTAERAGLLEQLTRLDEKMLTETPVADGWTVKDILAHISGWDRWELRSTKRVLAGGLPDFEAVRDMDAYNAALVSAWRDRALADVLTAVQGWRLAWTTWLRTVPEDEFLRERPVDGYPWSVAHSLKVEWEHDAEHAAQIKAWRAAQTVRGAAGPAEVLLLALTAAREELLSAAALVPPEQRESRPVTGEWTLKDVVGHLADWEWFGVDLLRQVAAGHAPRIEGYDGDEPARTEAHARARREQPWESVWRDLLAARQALLEVVRALAGPQLGQSFSTSWGTQGTPYGWLCGYLAHDRDHARGLRSREEAP